MHENGITVHHNGKSYEIELSECEANDISSLTAILEYMPRRRPPLRTPKEIKAWKSRYLDRIQGVEDFQSQLKRLAALDGNQMAILMGIFELIEFGDGNLSGGNWALNFIKDLSSDILGDG